VVYTRRSGRSRFTLLLLLLTALTLLVVDLPGTGPLEPVRNALGSVLSPVRETAVKVFDPVTNAWHGMFGYEDVKEENEALRRQLEQPKGVATHRMRAMKGFIVTALAVADTGTAAATRHG